MPVRKSGRVDRERKAPLASLQGSRAGRKKSLDRAGPVDSRAGSGTEWAGLLGGRAGWGRGDWAYQADGTDGRGEGSGLRLMFIYTVSFKQGSCTEYHLPPFPCSACVHGQVSTFSSTLQGCNLLYTLNVICGSGISTVLPQHSMYSILILL